MLITKLMEEEQPDIMVVCETALCNGKKILTCHKDYNVLCDNSYEGKNPKYANGKGIMILGK